MPPELVLIVVNLAFIGFGYGLAYPLLKLRKLAPLMRYDLAVTAAALVVAWALYGGSGTGFRLLGFEANWFVFGVVTFALLEVPAFFWFCRRQGIDLASEFTAPEE